MEMTDYGSHENAMLPRPGPLEQEPAQWQPCARDLVQVDEG
jgi:hypothetical protein